MREASRAGVGPRELGDSCPDFAEAGGKDPAKIDELLAKSREVVRAMLDRTT